MCSTLPDYADTIHREEQGSKKGQHAGYDGRKGGCGCPRLSVRARVFKLIGSAPINDFNVEYVNTRCVNFVCSLFSTLALIDV